MGCNMNKKDAIELIDQHKNKLIDPVIMVKWTWLRVIINQLTDDEWDRLLNRAQPILTK